MAQMTRQVTYQRRTALALWVLGGVVLASCGGGPTVDFDGSTNVTGGRDSAVLPDVTPNDDAAVDVSGPDGSVQEAAGMDHLPEAPSADAGIDESVDAEAQIDASLEASSDVVTDASLEASSDVVTEASTDAKADVVSACVASPNAIVSWWRGDGNFVDVFGTNSGFNAGAAAFGAGIVGTAFRFSGTAGSYALVPDSPSLSITGPATFDAWINPSTLGGRIIDKIQPFGANGYVLDVYGGKLRFIIGSDIVTSVATIPMGTFTHVAAVYDGASMRLYVNGVVDAAKPTLVSIIPTNNLPLHIGADSAGGSLFSGTIDEVRIVNGALSSAEIQGVYSQGAAARCGCVPTFKRVVSWWRGDGDYSDVFARNSGASAGTATFAAGEVGQGFSLTGLANSYVRVPDSPSLEITGPMTIDAWIKPTALDGRIIDKIQTAGANGYMLDTYGGKLRFIIGSDGLSSTATLATNVFTHVAAVYDGTNMSLYINGIAAGTKTTAIASIPVSALPLSIGADSTGANLFSGIIDEPRVQNAALSAAEVAQIAKDGAMARCGCAWPWPNLVSWWRGDGDFADSAGASPGINAGAATFATGEVGQGFSLTGSSTSYVQVADTPALDITGPLTIDAWIKATALGGRIVDKIQAGGVNGYMLDTYASKLRFIVGTDITSSNASLQTGVPTHVAAVYDGALMTVYIDGVIAGAKTTVVASIPTNTLPLRIGADSAGGSPFSGVIDEVRIFNRALSGGEIKAIYDAGGIARCQ